MEQDELQAPRDGSVSEPPSIDALLAELEGGQAPVTTPVEAPAPGATPTPAPAAPAPVATPTAAAAPPASPDPTRRRFLRYLLGFSVVSSLVMLAAPVVAFLGPPKEGSAGTGGKVSAGTTADIPPGKGKVVSMGSKPVIVINGEQGITAFSAICTHLGCIVAFDEAANNIVCPCHDGRFNAVNGSVDSGPPPAPLEPVTVSVEDDEIFLVES